MSIGHGADASHGFGVVWWGGLPARPGRTHAYLVAANTELCRALPLVSLCCIKLSKSWVTLVFVPLCGAVHRSGVAKRIMGSFWMDTDLRAAGCRFRVPYF
jgi:hypothetical protein